MSQPSNRANPKPPSVDRLSQLWHRINDHKMVQWSVAYVALAYGIQHAVILTSESFEWPNAVARTSMLLLALGLPLVMTLAWYHGQRASRRISGPELSILSVLLVGVSILFYVFARPSEQIAAGPKPAVQQAGIAATRSASLNPAVAISVAVLPFANVTGDASQDFFSDGMTDEISGALAKIPDLRVVARSSAFKFKGQNEEARTMGQALGATHLIEGSVRKAGNRVRISAELVQADNGLQVWSNSYDRELTDVFAIQEDIATAIAGAFHMSLGLKPGENLVNIRTKNEAVYEDYLRAKALVQGRVTGTSVDGGAGNLTEAVNTLEKIVAREPDFAPAWAQLTAAYDGLVLRNPAVLNSQIDEAKAVVASNSPKSEAAARRAIELDPKNADGYFALGTHLSRDNKYIEAIELTEKGMALNPVNPDGLNNYSNILADVGYLKRALPLKRQLLALEPFVPLYQQATARVLVTAGQYDDGIKMIEPYSAGGGVTIYANALAAKGQYREAADALQRSFQRNRVISAAMADAMLKLLRSAPAVAPPQTFPRLGLLGFLYAYVGAPEHVLDFYDDTLKIGFIGPGSTQFLWTPSLASVRKTERFKTYMRKIGMVDFWKQKGWPDLCRPTGTDDFVCD
jgi:TolB-like protein/tetratricopeptide (TPR) repeat protein